MSTKSAHVTVIGGGIIGSAIAYYIAKAGGDVVLLERGDIGSGSSTACSGAITMQTKGAGIKLKLAMESRDMYLTLGEELGEDLEYERDGGMIVAETEEELAYIESLSTKQRETGLGVNLLKKNQIKEQQPALSDGVLGATFSAMDGKVNALKVTFAFARAAKKAGARFHLFTTVKNIQTRDGKVCGVITDSGTINTETVINATGSWAPEIGRMVGIDIPILPRRGILVVTEIIPVIIQGSILSAKYLMSKYGKGPKDAAKSENEIPGGLVIRHTKTGNLVFGSSREFVGFNRNTTWTGIKQIVQEAARILPRVRGIHVIRTFVGFRPYSPDGLPILGPVSNLKGFIMAAGHEGDGISLAPLTGKMIANLIINGEFPETLNQLTLDRFK